MGNAFSSSAAQETQILPLSSNWWDIRQDDPDSLNGLQLAGVYVHDTLELILSYTPLPQILNLTKVCRSWKDVTTSRSFWRLVFQRNGLDFDTIPAHIKNDTNSWMVFYAVSKNKIITKNFILNPTGQSQLSNWTNIGNGRSRFIVECPPVGIDPLPFDSNYENEQDSAFVSCHDWCSKQQKIDLWKMGLTPAIMKLIVPFEFKCSEMIGSRVDCGGHYKIHVCLQDKNESEVVDEFLREGTKQAGAGWSSDGIRICIGEDKWGDLNNLRYIFFTHHGKDSQFWAGNYGVKFTRAEVRVKFNVPELEVESEPEVN